MRGNLFQSIFIAAVVVLSACGDARADQGPVKVVLPCDLTGYPNCTMLREHVINGYPPLKRKGIKEVVAQIMGKLYEGKLYSCGIDNSQGSAKTPETIGVPPVCPPAKLKLNGCKDEKINNGEQPSKNCGELSLFGMSASNVFVSELKNGKPNRETAHLYGLQMVAIQDEYNKVENEIYNNQLILDPASACADVARDLNERIEQHKSISNRSTLMECLKDPACMAKQYLDSGYENILAIYNWVARCRVIDVSSAKQREAIDGFFAKLETDVYKPCAERCMKLCKENTTTVKTPIDTVTISNCSAQELKTCTTTCRDQGSTVVPTVKSYEKWLQDYITAKFPQASEGCSP